MIKLEKVNKYFNRHKRNQIHVINNTSIDLEDTGLVALLGPSGCGKTTLLNAIGGLDKINSGKIFINGERISKRSSSYVDKVRNLNIGYIFQDFNLVDDMSAYDNVALSLKINGIKDKNEIKKRVEYVLEKVGMYKYRNKYAGMLSGGQRQRIGIARALVKSPSIIIADEPTGNLDSKNTIEVMNIIKAISKDRLVILVTHETELADFYATRILRVQDGQIVEDIKNEHNNGLDYKLDNKIYLKDIKSKTKFKSDKVEIDYYDDTNNSSKINIVVKNGIIYIESLDNFKIESIDNSSSIELVDDSYKAIDKSIFESSNFDFSNLSNDNIKMKYSSVFNVFSFIKNGFKKVLNYSFTKKLLLFGFLASAMFITYSISSLLATNKVDEKRFLKMNRNYILVEMQKIDLEEYNKIEKSEYVNYVIPSKSTIRLEISLDDIYQTYNRVANGYASLASIDMINKDEIIYGSMPKNNREVLIDKLIFENDELGNFKQGGILSYEDLLGRYIKFENDSLPKDFKYKIVGITDSKSPSLYSYTSEMINILDTSVEATLGYGNTADRYYGDMYNLFDINIYNDIKIVKGRKPTNDYEIIVNSNYEYSYPLNKETDKKVNDKKLKVVGYYSGYDYGEVMLCNTNTFKKSLLEEKQDLVIYAKDKEKVLKEFKHLNIKDSYEYSRNEYLKDKKDSNNATIIVSLFILGISLIEIYLMIRSSFLSRIKEIGIYRAIGMKKVDIYKMFTGEIISISTIGSLPGIALMSYILYELSTVGFISDKFIINIYVVILCIIFIFLFNIIVGLVPVYKVIRKTPAQILSRSDL